MWTCPQCSRIFTKSGQSHSCKSIPLTEHFQDKKIAQEIFDCLVARLKVEVGECRIISIPCCVHLFGNYDFLAALPKKDRLEIRFALNRKLDSQRTKISIPISAQAYKHCFDIYRTTEIDSELIDWIKESYQR